MKFSSIYQGCSDTLTLLLLYDGPRFPRDKWRVITTEQVNQKALNQCGTLPYNAAISLHQRRVSHAVAHVFDATRL